MCKHYARPWVYKGLCSPRAYSLLGEIDLNELIAQTNVKWQFYKDTIHGTKREIYGGKWPNEGGPGWCPLRSNAGAKTRNTNRRSTKRLPSDGHMDKGFVRGGGDGYWGWKGNQCGAYTGLSMVPDTNTVSQVIFYNELQKDSLSIILLSVPAMQSRAEALFR